MPIWFQGLAGSVMLGQSETIKQAPANSLFTITLVLFFLRRAEFAKCKQIDSEKISGGEI